MKSLNLTGKKFGRLTVLQMAGHRRYSSMCIRLWLCRCDCGKSIKTITRSLISGNTRSCGCLRQKSGSENPSFIHGYCPKYGNRSPEWRAYANAKQRCINPHNISYPYYGGRGIQFRYKSFLEFLADVGKRPSTKYTLDRANNNGHYEKGNCRWATSKVQVANRRIKKITDFSDDEIQTEFYRRGLDNSLFIKMKS